MNDATDTPSGRGGQRYRRVCAAMFAAGISTFVALYCPQGLLPLLAHRFAVSAATASLTMAVPTAGIALGLIPAGWLSDRWGRTRVMAVSLAGVAAFGLACALSPSFSVLLVLRGLQGLMAAGVPAVGTAYLAEEVDAGSLGTAVGLFIAGSGVGGTVGRILCGTVASAAGWRAALAAAGAVCIACAALFMVLAPAARRSVRSQRPGVRSALAGLAVHLRSPFQRQLVLVGALLMTTFVAAYNAIGFRLERAPYGLGAAAIGAVFLIDPVGSFAAAGAGRLADRIPRALVLAAGVGLAIGGLLLSLAPSLAVIVIALAVLRIGFFASHTVASGWVGHGAVRAPAQASSIYSAMYYVGASVAGPLGGAAWSAGGWPGVVAVGCAMLTLALVTVGRLALGTGALPALNPAAVRASA
jgi:YNFM family putative membrane transporter